MKMFGNLPWLLLFCLGVMVLCSCGTVDTSTPMGGSIQGTSLSLSGATSTLAGTAGSSGSADGTGTSARFFDPNGVTTDRSNFYVADSGNHTIRKVVIATGVVTTLAGTAGSSGSADGTGPSARFNNPYGITTDETNLYVADSGNHTIRKVVIATGVVTTLAGTAGSSGSTDNTGTSARFNNPNGITTDGTNLYVADSGNHTIRKVVIATGMVTTLAGTAGSSGSTDNTGTSARFNNPNGITTDGTNLYVADSANHTIRKVVIATGVVTTLAGTAGSSGSTDNTGTSARFNNPNGITTDGTNLYVADSGNHTIRRVAAKIVTAIGATTTLAGTAGSSGSADGAGTSARFYLPSGITTDGTRLLVIDMGNSTVRAIE
jgi:sugar lactone lactonase YvrE